MKKTGLTIGANIRDIRKQKGLTQIDLANLLNCSQAMITSYENNTKLPSVTTLIKIADVLDVSIDEITGKKTISNKFNKIKNPKLWKKFEQIEKLPENDKRTIFRLIERLLEKQKKD